MNATDILAYGGGSAFGLVVGWVTYRTLHRRTDAVKLGDIGVVVGAVGGAAITAIFDDKALFGAYSVGLAVGFFGYLARAERMFRDRTSGERPSTGPGDKGDPFNFMGDLSQDGDRPPKG
jgi:hypothetical protein